MATKIKKTSTKGKKPKAPAKKMRKTSVQAKVRKALKTSAKSGAKRKPKPEAARPAKKKTAKIPKVAVKKVLKKKPAEAAPRKNGHEHARQQLLKRQLIKRREEIVKEAKTEIAKYIKGEANQLVETALDDGDWSVIDLSADINLRLLETHRGSLLKIDESLRKLREGSYGVCEDCGAEISAERLKVMPFAIYCRDCQEKREEIEKIEKEEVAP